MSNRVRLARPRPVAAPKRLIGHHYHRGDGRVIYRLGLYVTAAINDHLTPRVRAAVTKKQRAQARVTFAGVQHAVPLPLHVTFTRIAPRALDSDNLPTAFKAMRDGIADLFGVRDNDDRVIAWHYVQHAEAPRTYGVEVAFEARR